MLSLLVLLPVSILLLSALGIVILQQVRPSIGYAWLIGSVGGLLTVGAMLFLRWRLPFELVIEPGRAFGDLSSPPAFRLDTYSWPYALCLAVVALAFLLTDAARLETEARPLNWAGGLVIIGIGMMAVMAANPQTLIFAWTAVDLVEFLMIMGTQAGQRKGEQLVRAFTIRVTGTLLVVLSILLARSQGLPFDLSPIPAPLAIFMLMSAGLRLGVLPLNVPFTREVYAWRGLGNVLRMIGPASSLMILGRMPEQVVPESWKGLFLGLSILAALYGAVMWLTTDHEINGRPYWSTSLAALAVASVINGSPRASIAWGTTLVLCGSVLFFYSARRKQVLYLPLLTVLGIVGLPFTPAASGWTGLTGPSSAISSLLFSLTVLFLIWGYIRHVLRPREELYRMERWVHAVYPTGLAFLILSQWVIGFLGWPGSRTVGVWWISVGTAFFAALGLVAYFSFQKSFTSYVVGGRWLVVFGRRAANALASVFRLNWLYRFLAWIYHILQNIVQLLTAMFEGDGGVLWSLVMLALLISIISAGAGSLVGGLSGGAP